MSPVSWLGGKSRLAGNILELFPPHHIYVEVFGGGAWVLLAKEPAPVEVYNDLDSGLVNFFRVLRDPALAPSLFWKVAHTPYSREEWRHCVRTWEGCDDPVERAYRWFVVSRQSFGGMFGKAWGSAVTASARGSVQTAAAWVSAVGRLTTAHHRLLRVQVEHQDFRQVLARYDTADTLLYCDPPYVPATRKGGSYRHELSLEDHRDLTRLLLGLAGMAILSGYDHAVYRPLEKAGWDKRYFRNVCHAAGHTRGNQVLGAGSSRQSQPRLEVVWISPSAGRARRQANLRPAQEPEPLLFGPGEED